ncbi:MAG: YfhO family protein [Lachnospiraceae bacterium]|nr:YfhO family protein [Lachnospiraceae bacterium]
MERKCNKKLLYALSFFIPVLMLLAIHFFHGIFPFGDATIMTGDSEYQFIDYLSYLKTIVFGNNDYSYSFSKNLGGNMAGFTAYYYLGPLAYISLLFPARDLPIALGVMLMLTVGLCSLTNCIYLTETGSPRKLNLLLAITYAYSGFLASYYQIILYYAAQILLPLVMLGLERLINDPKKRILYMVTLSAAVLTNYYSGYMICIFSLLMFIYKLLLRSDLKNLLKDNVEQIKSFIISSVLAVSVSAFNLIPTALSLSGSKDNFALGFGRQFPFSQVFSKLYTGAFKGNVSTGMPNIYCGMFVVLLLFVYFVDRHRALKEKLLSAGFIVFMLLNMYISTLDVIWHGMNKPIGFPFRYSYMLCFFMIMLSYKGYSNKRSALSVKQLLIFFGVFLMYSAYLLLVHNETTGIREILFSLLMLLCIAGIINAYVRKWVGRKFAFLIMGFVIILDLAFNASDALNYFELASLSEYRAYIDEMGKTVSDMKAQAPDEMYRTEKYVRRTHNDAMQFDYMGLSHFSSSEKREKLTFLGKTGIRSNGNWAFFGESNTALFDTLFGVKYIISKYRTIPNHYGRVVTDDEYKVFENDNYYGIMFISNRDIRHVDYSAYINNPFAFQEAIADNINGKDNKILQGVTEAERTLENLKEIKEDGYSRFERINKEEEAAVHYSVKVLDPTADEDTGENLFVYFDAPENQSAHIYRYDTDMGEYFTTYRWNVINMEAQFKGDTYEIRVCPDGDELTLSNAFFCYEDRDALKTYADDIKRNECHLKKLTSSHVTGEVNVNEDEKCVVMTIPYDENWSVTVDGVKVDTVPAVGHLISFDVNKGKHNIEMKYSPKGRKAGIVISMIALIICTIYSSNLFEKYHKK